MSQYARFRTWLIGQIIQGANPSHVASYLRKYKSRCSTVETSWADGLPELPTEREISHLEGLGAAW